MRDLVYAVGPIFLAYFGGYFIGHEPGYGPFYALGAGLVTLAGFLAGLVPSDSRRR